MNFRPMEPTDYPVLEDFLYLAIFIPPGVEPPPREIIYDPAIYIYIKDFGGRNDCGMVAEQNGEIVGAAWTRIIPAYGHVDDDTPELAISVLPQNRGKGIGTIMMLHLFDILWDQGFRKTSLSVQKDNPAVNLYKRLGYSVLEERPDGAGHEDYLMVKDL